MRVHFLRHAEALDGTDDAARPLSPKGRQQCRQVGRFLEDARIEFDRAYASPLVRARQTAEAVLGLCGRLKPDDLQIVDALLNETTARQFEGWLRALPEADHVLLVGHEPTLSARVRALLGIAEESGFRLPKGGLACVETEDGLSGLLKFFITPKVLGK